MEDSEELSDQIEQEQPSSADMPAMPVLPDGIGMNFDEVAALLAEKSRVVVGPDDPILMMVPLCNAFLEQERKLMEQHKVVLAKVLSEKTEGFVSAVQGMADEMGKTLASSTIESRGASLLEHREGMTRQQAVLERHQAEVRQWGMVAAISAAVNVAVFVLLFLLGR